MDDTHDDPAPSVPDPEDDALETADPADVPPIAERIADALQAELDADEGQAS